MMKQFYAILLAAALLPLCAGASAEGEGRTRLNQETGRLSILLLMHEWEKNLPEAAVTRLENHLYQSMLANPGANVRRSAARAQAAGCLDRELNRMHEEKLRELLAAAKLEPSAGAGIISGAERQNFVRQTRDRYIENAFQKARQRLVAEQKNQVFRRIYPELSELEQFDDARLSKVLENRFQQGLAAPLWEENVAIARRELIMPVIQSGRKQQKRQLELVRALTVPPELWDRADVAKYLTVAVAQSAFAKLAPEEKHYDLFAATRSAIANRAAWLPAERVIAAMPGNLPPEAYRDLLEAHPEAHRTAEQSQSAVRETFVRLLTEDGLRKSGIPAQMAEKLRSDAKFRTAAEAEFTKRFAGLLPVRTELAVRQLRRDWPELERGDWRPELTETERYAASGSKEIPELQAEPARKTAWLDETVALRDRKVREALGPEVVRLEAQKSGVTEIYAQVLQAMQKEQKSLNEKRSGFLALFFPNEIISLETIVSAYRKMVLEHCEAPLFPAVEEEIEVRSRAILAEVMEMQKKAEAVPEEKEPEQEVEIPIRLSGQAGQVNVAIGDWQRSYPIEAVRNDEIGAALRQEMQKTTVPAKFTVKLMVTGKSLYYHTVAEMQSALETSLDCKIEDQLQR